jgi:hypothetical protein
LHPTARKLSLVPGNEGAGLLHVVGLDDKVHPRAVAEPEEALHDALGVKFGQDPRLLGPVGLELAGVRDGSRRMQVHE